MRRASSAKARAFCLSRHALMVFPRPYDAQALLGAAQHAAGSGLGTPLALI